MPGLLELAHKRLGWPSRRDIMRPKGSGPAIIAELARRKLKTAIERDQENVSVEVGVLAANPCSDKTEEPLAIVCDFESTVSEDVLRKTHRLAWSFSRSPMLMTIEPSAVKVWTCWKKPVEEEEDVGGLCVERADRSLLAESSMSEQAARALQWVELASGNFLRKDEYSKYFRRDQRADQLMLEDLKALRRKLLDAELPVDICHDLIARVIFIEFLFQRKDSQGHAALNEKVLAKLHDRGVLRRVHNSLSSILRNHGETYRFFRELNGRFNGDLFPGKGDGEEEREREWKAEMGSVKKEHLNLLGEFVRGEMEIATGQRCLWKRYAFDVIPLEFISSIYEEFVSNKRASGAHYTPVHIVDYMLDSVLPWNDTDWNKKILDPACGSGIFLVKAYQRLIHRWKLAQGPEAKPGTPELRSMLENNLLGVDINPHAVRVASFSLYLAMCDELEPRYVWQNVKFPRLRDRRLLQWDFFSEDQSGYRTKEDGSTYDLVIGNAPWGHDLATSLAESWANSDKDDPWPVPYKSPGPLFLVKAAFLSKQEGRVCMIQPAQALLTNRQAKAVDFRRKFFTRFKVEEIVNLAALRFGLFKDSISPACIITLRQRTPDEGQLRYLCPKPTRSREDEYHVIIEPNDINYVSWYEAAVEAEIWSTLMWGGPRDLALARKLKKQQNLASLTDLGQIRKRQGIVRGDRTRFQSEILGRRILETQGIPSGSFLFLEAERLPVNTDGYVHSRDSTDFRAFQLPQLVVKQSWKAEGRFKASIVLPGKSEKGIICSKSYVSVHAEGTDDRWLKAACLSYNSILAVYYLFLTSGRCSGYIPEAYVEEILSVPIADVEPEIFDSVRNWSDVDERTRHAFGFNDAEWALVRDMSEFTLPDFKGGPQSPGRQSTMSSHGRHGGEGTERVLANYIDYFVRVLQAGFGEDKDISATIFREAGETSAPVRLVAIHLETPGESFTSVENIDSTKLIERLKKLNERFLKAQGDERRGGIFYQRVARVYDSISIDGKDVPSVFIIKPDQVRYWTRSMAMRDADEVAGEIMLWREEAAAMRG